MKNLMLGMSGILLLAMQVNAQQQKSTTLTVSQNDKVATTVSTSSSYSYTQSDVKNMVNIKYNDRMYNQDVQDDSPVKSKAFSKTFSLAKSDKVNLSNQYGSITIKTWDRNEIKVDAAIKAYAKSDNEAQELLDEVTVNGTKDGDLVTFKTSIVDRNRSWGSSVKNGKTIWRREVKVHYTVYMPTTAALTASQTYGGITMDDYAGPTSIKVQYGNFDAGNLSNANNYLSIQYGKGNVKDFGNAKIKHQYGGGLTLGTIGNIDLDAQYTAVNIGTIKGNAVIKHQYGSGTTIGTASTLNANAQYTTVKVGTLRGNINSKTQYGKIIIDEIEAGKNVEIDASYSSVSLGFANNYNADFEVSTNYGNFKYGSNVNAKRLGGDDRSYSSSKNYTGQIGKGGSAKVSINSQYNTVTFK